MHFSVVLGDEGAWKEGKSGQDSGQDSSDECDPALFQTKPERAPWLFWTFATPAQSQRTKAASYSHRHWPRLLEKTLGSHKTTLLPFDHHMLAAMSPPGHREHGV
jgi:hypothetical protein